MRLWHIDILPYLPKSQLVAQWRELNSIFVNQNKHILINYVYNYDKYYLQMYAKEVMYEMDIRGINHNDINYMVYFNDLPIDSYRECNSKYPEHNFEYLTICYYNLREKYIRGQKDFTPDIWEKLDKFYKGVEKYGNSKEYKL